jgi:hypothetical protein
MKKIFFGISTVIVLMSLLSFLYGCVKLTRNENKDTVEIIDADINVVQNEILVSKEASKQIITVSLMTFLIGASGLFLTSKKQNLD